jgi:Transposase DDE domain
MASRRRCCHSTAPRARRARVRCGRRPDPGAVWRDQEWARVRPHLPADLEASARASGALRRRREVRSAAALLRLVLAYALCGWPLRLVAAWATVLGVGRLSDVALLDRLRGTRAWLGGLVAALVADGRAAGLGRPVRLRLVDATTVSRPGSTGVDWRVHLSLSLAPWAVDGLELTDGRGAEALTRHPARPGDIQVADRGHARRSDLGAVLAQGGALVVRIGWQNLPLLDADDRPLDLLSWLRALGGPAERPARVQTPDGVVAIRLVAAALPAEAAEAARRRLRRAASKKSRTADRRSLEAAGYVVLVTNLPADAWRTAEVLALYRVRWQVELVFKQLKGIWRLGALRARTAELAQVYLLGTLLAALLAARVAHALPAAGPAWFDAVARPLSLWRWQLLWHAVLRDAVLGALAAAAVRPLLPVLRRFLCDAPRRRLQQAALTRRLLDDRCRDRPTPPSPAPEIVHA